MAAHNAAPVETVHDKLRMHACVAGHAGIQYRSHEHNGDVLFPPS